MDVSRSSYYLLSGVSQIKAAPGRIKNLSVLAASQTVTLGMMYDSASVVTTSLGGFNAFSVIPVTLGQFPIDWWCGKGIVASVPPGMTIAISYE